MRFAFGAWCSPAVASSVGNPRALALSRPSADARPSIPTEAEIDCAPTPKNRRRVRSSACSCRGSMEVTDA